MSIFHEVYTSDISDLTQNSPGELIEFAAVATSEHRCLVCHSKVGRSRVPRTATVDLFLRKQVYVRAEGVRTCPDHLENGLFTVDAIQRIQASFEMCRMRGNFSLNFRVYNLNYNNYLNYFIFQVRKSLNC